MTTAHAWNPGGFDRIESATRDRVDDLIAAFRALPGVARVQVSQYDDRITFSLQAPDADGPEGVARLVADLGLPDAKLRTSDHYTWLQSTTAEFAADVTLSVTGDWRTREVERG